MAHPMPIAREPSATKALTSCTLEKKSLSLFYSILPAVVQSRVPKLPSIRRSVTDFRKRGGYGRSLSIASTSTEGRSESICSQATTVKETQGSEYDEDVEEISETPCDSRPVSVSSSGFSTPRWPYFASESESGIVWKYANHGLGLLDLASQDSSSLTFDRNVPSFSRQVYIDAMAYLLRGLPRDLTLDEALSVRAALPPNISNLLQSDLAGREVILSGTQLQISEPEEEREARSTLHRFVASIIVWLLIVVHFLRPYVQLLVARAYRYEREYKLSERVGQAINDTTVWWAKGIAGGLQEGLREGIVILRDGSEATRKTR